MVQVNNKTGKVTISFDGDCNTVTQMQLALIDLMQSFDFENNNTQLTDTFHNGLSLLKAMLPTDEQAEKAFLKSI